MAEQQFTSVYVSRRNDRELLDAYRGAIKESYALGERIAEENKIRVSLPAQLTGAYEKALTAAKAKELRAHPLNELAAFPYNFSLTLLDSIRQHAQIDDLLNARGLTMQKLDAIPGFGPIKAQQFLDALYTHSDSITTKTRVNLNDAQQSKATQALLTRIYLTRIYQGETFNPTSYGTVERFLDNHELVDEAELTHLTSWGSFFNPRSKRRQAVRAVLAPFVNTYRQLPIQDLRAAVDQQLKVHRARAATSINTAWKDYRGNAATYQAILATLEPDTQTDLLGEGFAGGGITEQLWQRINAVELNLDGFKGFLRPYQTFGVKFAFHQRRILLGDDMGLGKSAQALALFTHLSNQDPNTHLMHLVVSPLSVQKNWINEINKFTSLRAVAITDKRQVVDPAEYDIAVTTYERLSDDTREKVNGVIVVDEAHMAKNPTANRTQRILRLVKNRTHVMFMTGTAIENRLDELTRLVSFVNPFLAQKLQELGENPSVQTYKEAIALAYLRRNKEDVLKELPELTVKDDWTPMTKTEQGAYIDALGEGWHAARQTAFHVADSGKLERIEEIMDAARAGGEKVLIFSFYLGNLDSIQRKLATHAIYRIDGSIDPEKRQSIVDQFNNHDGSAVFMAQIDTGGVGLNLQSASTVILCEPQLKPSTETQAFARAHRMGQLNPVTVYRLLTEGTIDERINDLRNEKAALFQQYAQATDLGDRSVSLEISNTSAAQILAEERAKYRVKR